MDFSIGSILAFAQFTVQNPRAAARGLMAMGLPDTARWLLFGVVATASAVLTHVGLNLLPPDESQFMADAMASPVRTAFFQGGLLLIAGFAITAIGRWQGGKGSFGDALLLISWLQFVLLCLQVVQIVALLVLPPVAEIIGVLGLGLSFWLLTQFIVELHGFASSWRVLFGIVAAILAVAVAISVVLTVLVGVGVGG